MSFINTGLQVCGYLFHGVCTSKVRVIRAHASLSNCYLTRTPILHFQGRSSPSSSPPCSSFIFSSTKTLRWYWFWFHLQVWCSWSRQRHRMEWTPTQGIWPAVPVQSHPPSLNIVHSRDSSRRVRHLSVSSGFPHLSNAKRPHQCVHY